jgi:hypothetical protein
MYPSTKAETQRENAQAFRSSTTSEFLQESPIFAEIPPIADSGREKGIG